MGFRFPGPVYFPCPFTWALLHQQQPWQGSTVINHLTEWETEALRVKPPAQDPVAGEWIIRRELIRGA